LNSFVDPRQVCYFTGRQREATKQLGTIVKSLGADIGVLLNSGAEKIIAVTEKGDVISSQKLLLKVTQLYCEAAGPGKIAVPVAASSGIEMIAKDHGARIEWIPGDHQAMMEAANSGKSVFVGGTKGGFLFPGFQLGVDAMFATVKIFEMLVRAGQKIGRITGSWDKLVMVEKAVACPWSKKGQVMRSLMRHSEGFERILVDGARFSKNGNWVLVRPDRKRAQFFVQAESNNSGTARELAAQYVKYIKSWQK
jgi:mannose-1-phosphate guanylyltransferase/phosphomannomutase